MKCVWCGGTGLCEVCEGDGAIPENGIPQHDAFIECPECEGSGVCPLCEGSGLDEDDDDLDYGDDH